jgi:transcriptional regulator
MSDPTTAPVETKTASRFEARPQDVSDLIAEFPLAWVIPSRDSAELATPLPLLAEMNAAGDVVSLLGHMARRNPLYPALQAVAQASLLFMGPQGYVSPACVSDPTWAPTWNYAQVRIEAEIQFLPDQGGHSLDALVSAMDRRDQTGWKAADVGPRYSAMEQAIIAFRARVTKLHDRFKLGQDESERSLCEILERHTNQDLVRWMRRMNAHRL